MYGPILSTPPKGYIPYQQWPEFDLGNNVPTFLGPELVGHSTQGLRWGIWPIYFEEYVSSTEPVLADSNPVGHAPNRLLVWRRPTAGTTPSGWWQLGRRPSRLEGFRELIPTVPHERTWSESARRYRKHWLSEHANKTHRIEPVSFAEFKEAYLKSPVATLVREDYLILLSQRLAGAYAAHIEVLGVRDLRSGEVVAGAAFIHSPTHHASYYHCGFIRSEAARTPCMVGLMDHWHEQARARNEKFLHFGEFWIPGKPARWKGFSLFKSKFGLHYIQYPPALVRPRRGRIFNFKIPSRIRLIPSDKNGSIAVSRPQGRVHVEVGGCEQTSLYTHRMWHDAFMKVANIQPHGPVRSVLMLGLGAGGELKELYERFPGSAITAVEHDQAMISLMEKLALHKPHPKPRVIQGDAAEVVPSLKKTFDLIVVDLFTGEEPPAFITAPAFLVALKKILSPGGLVLLNAYKRADFVDAVESNFTAMFRWKYHYNNLGLFAA